MEVVEWTRAPVLSTANPFDEESVIFVRANCVSPHGRYCEETIPAPTTPIRSQNLTIPA
jgi:hypothetical protein